MEAVVLLGPPGAGKGTVATVLAENGYRHVSTGELLREQIRLQTPLGREAGQLMAEGKFVSDAVVVGMIRGMLEPSATGTRVLFDGFPRTLVQAEQLDDLFTILGGSLSAVVLLECPDEVIVERLSGRRTCQKCGAVYHLKYNPALSGERCDSDGSELEQRLDDRAETIRERLKVYAEQTAPLVDYYRKKGLVRAVDATQSIDNVRHAVMELLG